MNSILDSWCWKSNNADEVPSTYASIEEECKLPQCNQNEFLNTNQAIDITAYNKECTLKSVGFTVGQRVRVLRYKYAGEIGTITELLKAQVWVESSNGERFRVARSNIEEAHEEKKCNASCEKIINESDDCFIQVMKDVKEKDSRIKSGEFTVGQRVRVLRYKYANKIGTITELLKAQVWVESSNGERFRVARSNIEEAHEETKCDASYEKTIDDNVCENGFIHVMEYKEEGFVDRGCRVKSDRDIQSSKDAKEINSDEVIVGQHFQVLRVGKKGKVGMNTKLTNKQAITVDGKEVFKMNSQRYPWQYNPTEEIAYFGKHPIKGIVLASEKNEANNFLESWLGQRLLNVTRPLAKDTTVEVRAVHNNDCYELINSKAELVSTGRFQKTYHLKLLYVLTEGTGSSSLALQDELEKLANFASLSPRKVLCRLQLLSSPSSKDNMFSLSVDDLHMIDENGNVGCGYISEELLQSLIKHVPHYEDVFALQVRIIAPRRGIFKGVLMKKQRIHGIHLPPSMMKVGPSIREGAQEWACLLVTCQGVFPSSNNKYLRRSLMNRIPKEDYNKLFPCTKLPRPPPPSYDKVLKSVSPMIQTLWRHHQVPEKIVESYLAKTFHRCSEVNHGWVVGVADPTDSIPYNQIYVTGLSPVLHLLQPNTEHCLFITRSPCVEAQDGRRIKVLTEMNIPRAMSTADWEWLKTLPFGAVIFGYEKSDTAGSTNMKSIPETIADGDLDGDLYFICWDEELVNSVQLKFNDSSYDVPADSYVPCDEDIKISPNWLEESQIMMTNVMELKNLNYLIGSLFNLCKSSDKSGDTEAAVLFGQAYKASLDFRKHGRLIFLPEELQQQLKPELHQFFCSSK